MRWIDTESCCDYVQILQSGVEKKKWAGDREDCHYAPHGASPMTYVWLLEMFMSYPVLEYDNGMDLFSSIILYSIF